MRRLLPLLAFAAACGSVEKPNTDITHHTPVAKVRALALVADRPALDLLVTVKDEVPATLGAVASPGASAFSDAPAGDSQMFAVSGGKPFAQLETKTAEGGTYTAVVTGSGSDVKIALVTESLAPAPGKARVRFLDATGTATSARVGGDALTIGTAQPGDWADLAPADAAKLEISGENGLIATFSGIALTDGSLTTFALAGSPAKLLVVHDGPFSQQLLDPDGTVKPKARVRFVDAAEDAGTVDFSGDSQTPLAAGLAFKELSEDVEVAVDAQLKATSGGAELASEKLALDPAKTYTIALIGRKSGAIPLRLAVFEDRRDTTNGPTARLVVAVPGMPGQLSLTQTDGSPLLPATSYGAASEYTQVPAGTLDAVAHLTFGPQSQPIATLSGLTFPADHALSLLAVGSLSQTPAESTLSVLFIDDHDGRIVGEKTPEPLPAP